MPNYYDYVLGLVPVALVGITGALRAAGVDPMAAIPVGAAVAALVVGHALFVNGPVVADGTRSGRSAADHGPVNAD
ncbi:hypothetical protein [Haloplanus pelagicus]|jgi:hypothetical protein|uniref:hypothetical protein n=1 Tax=Haloplanus pelagicus TaxID=2949995 RepID=UPI00203D0143|nr:hypothetical protein [Haloplanus sp. HW8-1]